MKGPPRWVFAAAVGVASGALFFSGGAEARVEAESGYTKTQTYSGALRYLRLDLGYEIVEKDPDAAYLLFRYAPPGQNKRLVSGTLEVVETPGNVKVFVQLPQMPEYHERMLRDGLLKKLRVEYGAPPTKKAAKPEKKPPADAGAG